MDRRQAGFAAATFDDLAIEVGPGRVTESSDGGKYDGLEVTEVSAGIHGVNKTNF
jgi:hypothetical protein